MFLTHYRLAALFSSGIMLFFPGSGGKKEAVVRPPDKLKGHTTTHVARHRTTRTAPFPYKICLTFDDGPSAGSRQVNALSIKDSLPINVFLIGRNACLTMESRSLVKDYQENGLVEIGNHSYSHAYRKYEAFFKQPSAVLADFNRSRDSLQLTNGLARLPGRNFFRLDSFSRNDHNNGKEAADTLAANGYLVYGWDLEWRRKAGKGIGQHTGAAMLDIASAMLENRRTFLPGRLVILLHDQDLRDPHFREEVVDFIQRVRVDGRYQFQHLSEW